MICRNCKKEIGGAAECPYCHTQQEKKRAPFALRPGTVLAGRYAISKVADTDKTCITYDAWDKRAKKMLTVKEYFPAGVVKRQKFNREPAACVSFFRLSDAERQANALRPGSYVRCPAAAADYFESGKRRFCFDMMQRASADEKFIDFLKRTTRFILSFRAPRRSASKRRAPIISLRRTRRRNSALPKCRTTTGYTRRSPWAAIIRSG